MVGGRVSATQRDADRDLAKHLLPPYGRPAAIENVGVAAAPLLAGFSFALVGLILQIESVDRKVAEPNIALAMLVAAGLLLVNAVQCAFNARQYHVPADEWQSLVELFPEGSRRNQLWENQVKWVKMQAKWVARTRRLYNLGVLVLFAGVAVTLLPPGPVTEIDGARLVAVGIAVGGSTIEFAGVSRANLSRAGSAFGCGRSNERWLASVLTLRETRRRNRLVVPSNQRKTRVRSATRLSVTLRRWIRTPGPEPRRRSEIGHAHVDSPVRGSVGTAAASAYRAKRNYGCASEEMAALEPELEAAA